MENKPGADAREWIAAHWREDLTLREWWQMLHEHRWAFPAWPEEHGGRGLRSPEIDDVLHAFDEAGIIGAPTGLGVLMGAPIVMTRGSHEQVSRFLGRLATGVEGWCQLFSEPGAGSDLASASCRAERDGDEWIINGQKVWTSGALDSSRGMLIARTDPEQPKHRGMSYFIIEMDQPGVEIRPIKQMNGKSHFNEVFFTDARVADADRIGEPNNGWSVATATLAFERSGLSHGSGGGVRVPAGERAGLLDRAVGDLVAEARAARHVPDEHGGLSATLRALGKEGDDVARQQMTTLVSHERIADMTRQRIEAGLKAGGSPGPEASTAKLWWTEGLRVSRDLGVGLLGADGMLTGEDTPGEGTVQHFFLSMPSASIAGGSDEIQRNIIGERVLGLPRDILHDPETPFNEIPRN